MHKIDKKGSIEPLFLNVAYLLLIAVLFLGVFFIVGKSFDNEAVKSKIESREFAMLADIGYNSETGEEFILKNPGKSLIVFNLEKGQTEVKSSEAVPYTYSYRFFQNSGKESFAEENEIKIS